MLQNNPGKRRLNANEPDPAPAIPTCPDHLNDIGKKEWRRVTKELLALGIVKAGVKLHQLAGVKIHQW